MGRRSFANATAASTAVQAPKYASHSNTRRSTTNTTKPSNPTRNTDAAHAAFAQTTILNATPPDYRMAVDDTLGAYITNQLKNHHADDEEALVELIQEQCHVEWDTASEIIQTITLKASQLAAELLPNDLLDEGGALDVKQPAPSSTSPDATHFPPLGAAQSKPNSKPIKTSKASSKSVKATVANQVAAALFPPTRSRQSSIDESSSRRSSSLDETHSLQPNYAPQQQQHYSTQQQQYYPPQQQHYLQQQHPYQDYYYSTAEMLRSMNAELSHEAAYAAAMLANADFNMAQYLVESTATEPPMCRDYLVQNDCYRSDCPFSHALPESHTCVFWFKSYCAKGANCRFRHGFSDRWIQQCVPAPPSSQPHDNPLPLHPAAAMAAAPRQDTSFSFAKIAQQNYTPHDTFVDETATKRQSQKIRSVLIPADVWNVNENRDASVFTIDDPMERYAAVQRHNHKENVMDLHFQSLKTFPVVLDTILDGMLKQYGSVWIVTGTGHHVGQRTHQKSGGALEAAVVEYLDKYEYSFRRGKDKTGQGGALLVENYSINAT